MHCALALGPGACSLQVQVLPSFLAPSLTLPEASPGHPLPGSPGPSLRPRISSSEPLGSQLCPAPQPLTRRENGRCLPGLWAEPTPFLGSVNTPSQVSRATLSPAGERLVVPLGTPQHRIGLERAGAWGGRLQGPPDGRTEEGWETGRPIRSPPVRWRWGDKTASSSRQTMGSDGHPFKSQLRHFLGV